MPSNAFNIYNQNKVYSRDETLLVQIWDKNLKTLGSIRDYTSIKGSILFNNAGVLDLKLAGQHKMNNYLVQDGVRMSVTLITPGITPRVIFTGFKIEHTIDLRGQQSSTYRFIDDNVMLRNRVALVAPTQIIRPTTENRFSPDWWAQSAVPDSSTGALGNNGTTKGHYPYYYWGTAPMSRETAIKKLVSENFLQRQTYPNVPNFVIAPDQNRGGVSANPQVDYPQIRMWTCEEAVREVALPARLGYSIRQETVIDVNYQNRFVFDVYQTQIADRSLRIDSTSIINSTLTVKAPTVSRVIIGGLGEGVERAFFGGIPDPDGRETQWGQIFEVFTDQTGLQMRFPDNINEDQKAPKRWEFEVQVPQTEKDTASKYFTDAGVKKRREGSGQVILDLELRQSGGFQVFIDYQLGDSIKVTGLEDEFIYSQQVDEVEMNVSGIVEMGVRTGGFASSPERVSAKKIVDIANRQRILGATK